MPSWSRLEPSRPVRVSGRHFGPHQPSGGPYEGGSSLLRLRLRLITGNFLPDIRLAELGD